MNLQFNYIDGETKSKRRLTRFNWLGAVGPTTFD